MISLPHTNNLEIPAVGTGRRPLRAVLDFHSVVLITGIRASWVRKRSAFQEINKSQPYTDCTPVLEKVCV